MRSASSKSLALRAAARSSIRRSTSAASISALPVRLEPGLGILLQKAEQTAAGQQLRFERAALVVVGARVGGAAEREQLGERLGRVQVVLERREHAFAARGRGVGLAGPGSRAASGRGGRARAWPARGPPRSSPAAGGSAPPAARSGSPRRAPRRSRSRTSSTLPSDFDIFSRSTSRKPLCSQKRASGLPPWAQALCAISFSWCGNCRSRPPPWMSIVSPRCASAIAEHSMCQPGRPRPQGLSQPGCSGARRLPQHEVAGVALVRRDLDARAGEHLLARAARERAVLAETTARRTARGPRPRRRGRSRSAARSSR